MFGSVKFYHAVLFVFGVALTSNASAIECYKKSPNWIILDDEYFNLERSRKISASERDKLNDLFDSLRGKWSGKLTIDECTGPDRAPRVKTLSAKMSTEITSTSSGALNLKAEMKDPDDRVTKYKKVILFGDINVFEFDFINKSNVIYSERYRRRNVSGGSRLVEYIHDLRFTGSGLTIVMSTYINGVLTTTEEWSMD